MKGNEISVKELRPDAVEWLTKLHQTMVVKEYGKVVYATTARR